MKKKDRQQSKHGEPRDLEFLKLQYQVLSDRRISHDSLLWNMPSILFVALTLLWNIALDSKVDIIIRCIVSAVSFLVGLTAYWTFERNRVMEVADAEQMFSIEKLLRTWNVETGDSEKRPILIVNHLLEERTWFSNKKEFPLNDFFIKKPQNPLGRKSPLKLWRLIFWFFMGLSVLIFLYNLYYLLSKIYSWLN